MTDNKKNNPANTTEMTDQQAATNDLQGTGRGARQEPGATTDQQNIAENVKGDARGDMPDIPSMDRANQADKE
ncbi:hypothetical protein ACFOPQ_14140 [Deinococcus antarcticus]|uniref:Uncharacterized protein n=1 Tax=Deinococcus antarcticus TaxID=1298767 RepID=A0ABV8A8U9_9DEIO